MRSLELCFYFIIITWNIVHSEKDAFDDTAIGFPEDEEDTEFVDPYSFNYDRANKKMHDRHAGKFARSGDTCIYDGLCQIQLNECKNALDNIQFDRLFTKRLINLILSAAKLQVEGDLVIGSVTLSGTIAQIEELKEFGDGKTTTQQVDAILSEMIRPSMNIFAETFSWIDQLRFTILEYKGITIAILAAILVLLAIKYVNWGTRKVIVILLSCMFLVSFFIIWLGLMTDADLKHTVNVMKHKEPPVQCKPEKMNMWDRIKTHFHQDDQCFEYYKSLEFNALHAVTPIDALIETCDRLMLQPIARIGTVINGFIQNSTKSLGYPMSWIITIILYVCIIGIIGVMLVVGLSGNFRIWFGPFCGISMGGRERTIKDKRASPVVVILERNSDGELRQHSSTAVPCSLDGNELTIGGGDTKTQKKQARSQNAGPICSSCCCKSSSYKPHVQDDEDIVNRTTKSEVRSIEKGDGDR